MIQLLFVLIALILIFILVYRNAGDKNIYQYLKNNYEVVFDKIAPYSYKQIRNKVKSLGQDYSTKKYIVQIILFGGVASIGGYLYFRSIIVAILYGVIAIAFIPYLSYLRYKRIYSEFIFEQIQTYTTNVIMEFGTTQSFVKSLEGVIESGVLEDPVKRDVEEMIRLSYENGTIDASLEYFEEKYDFYIVKNMHQLFLQITNEGAKDASESLENMSLDIDMLVESVYRDREDRAVFQKKFIRFGLMLYGMIMLVQLILGQDTYKQFLNLWYGKALIHFVVILNSYFLIKGEKYYNENVGAE